MSKKITLSGWVVWEQWSWEKDGSFTWTSYKPSVESDVPDSSCRRVAVCEQAIEIEVPEKFDPRPGMVEALEAQKTKLSADFHKRVTEINQQIQNLQALEFDGVSA